MSKKSAKRNLRLFFLGVVVAVGVAGYLFESELRPCSPGTAIYVRVDAKESLSTALHDLQRRGVIRNAAALGFYARLKKRETIVEAGTYSVAPGMSDDDILKALRTPVTVKVTIPEGYWIEETAERMDEATVAKAEDYVAVAEKPKEFAKAVTFPLPKASLEGYLFPDTYRMQP